MMKVIKRILLAIVIVVGLLVALLVIGSFTGLVVVDSEGGNHSEYATLSDDEKARVMDITDMDNLKADGNVYRVRHEQVRHYLNGRGKAVVYSYIPYCTKEGCVDPVDCFKKCDEAGVELLLISELYYKLFENTTDYPQPVFVINSESYGTDDREDYVKLFYNGLVGEENWSRLSLSGGGLYFCFNRAKYIGQFKKLDKALEFLKKE